MFRCSSGLFLNHDKVCGFLHKGGLKYKPPVLSLKLGVGPFNIVITCIGIYLLALQKWVEIMSE